MLNYSIADYCMLIWDDANTTAQHAIDNLQSQIDPNANKAFTVTFRPFHMHGWNLDDEAKKVLEEAAEIRGELQHEPTAVHVKPQLHHKAIEEAFDTMQAAANFIALAVEESDHPCKDKWQDIYDMVVEKNKQRGYYDD